ncbi:MAG: tetratricopeptide repeat protein [Clostridia bacterium]|nr:tetratricopeptide repeat protein [Clostridia bacterium]
MKKINIFLASSIVEFAQERMAIENFIRNVSDSFEDNYNVKLQPLLCENLDDAYTLVRKQEEYNQKIRESDFCFFIFFTKVGTYTREEFSVAREQFEQSGKPKIYTYFKIVPEGEAEQSVYDFMAELDKTFSHYYGTFSHIDTVKLRILLSLKLQEMDYLKLSTQNGKCLVDGEEVLSLKNVSEFANNQLLTFQEQNLEKLDQEYYSLKAKYNSSLDNEDFYTEFIRVAAARQTLLEEIEELQESIFNVSVRMIKDDAHGEISPRQKKAYALFEQGDYEGCLAVLDENDLDNEFLRKRKRIKEQEIALCRKYIKENKTAIDILTVMKHFGERFDQIESRYKKIVPVILEMGIELEVAFNYVWFLIDQNRDDEALPLAEKLLPVCDDEDLKMVLTLTVADIYNKFGKGEEAEKFYLEAVCLSKALENPLPALSTVYNCIGTFYCDQENASKAEEYFLESLKISQELKNKNPERFSSNLATSYSNIGVFYDKQCLAAEAEKYYLAAAKLYEELTREDPEHYEARLSIAYKNIGTFYREQGKLDLSKDFCLKSIDILEKLAQENPQGFLPLLASGYDSAGNTFDELNLLDKAEEYHLKALKIYEQFAQINPDKFNYDLALTASNLGSFYLDAGDTEKGERFCLEALKLTEALAKDNPKRFEPDLAMCLCNAGSIYAEAGEEEKAEELFLKALEIRKRLAEDNPQRYSYDLSMTQNNLGNLYDDLGEEEKAEQFFLEALEIRKKLAEDNPDRFLPSLSNTYNDFGVFYDGINKPKKAKECFLESLKIRTQLAKENPKKYSYDLSSGYHNAAIMLEEDAETAKSYYLSAIEIRAGLAKENPQLYAPALAISYYDYGTFIQDDSLIQKAIKIAKEFPSHRFSQVILSETE